MAWYAKPSGGYSLTSAEAQANMTEIYGVFSAQGYTLEAVAGMIGSFANESAMNPWRWQSDTVSYSAGYGLVQFTPASGYINLSGISYHSPNLSTSSQTSGATPEDGIAQCIVIYTDALSKWVNNIWRDYWSTSTYATEYARMQSIRNRYGRYISQDTFKSMTNLEDATFVFNGGYVGELALNIGVRDSSARTAYEYLSGVTPPTPPTPPTGETPIWLLMRTAKNKDKNKLICPKKGGYITQ